MSVVEICLTKLINCTGDNEVEIEAILNTANYICHTEDLGMLDLLHIRFNKKVLALLHNLAYICR